MKHLINIMVMIAFIFTNHTLKAQQSYIYATTIQDEMLANLRPSPTSIETIRKCKKGEIVYVLDTNDGIYYKVQINGRIGYITKACLHQKLPGNINSQVTQRSNDSAERFFEWAGNKYSVEKLKNLFIREREDWLRRNNYSNRERELFDQGFNLMIKAMDAEGFGRNPDGSWTNTIGVSGNGIRDTGILGSTKNTINNAVGLAVQLLDYVMQFLPVEPKKSLSSNKKNDFILYHVIGRINFQGEKHSISIENDALLINNGQIAFINPATKETLFEINVNNKQDNDTWHLYTCTDQDGKNCGVALPKYLDMGQQLVIVQDNVKVVFILYEPNQLLENENYRNRVFLEEFGRVLQFHELFEDAISYYKQACDFGGKGKGLYSAIAKCYLEIGEYQNAINLASKALNELPDQYCDRDEYIYNVRGCAKYVLGIASYKDDLNKGGVAGQNILKGINANPQSRPQVTNKLKKDPNFKIN